MRLSAALALLLTAACATPAAHAPAPVVTPTAPPAPTTPAAATPPAPAVPATPLATGPHGAAMTEVTLDPLGQAAITVDRDGAARLWPDLRTHTGAPIVLPFSEAGWISLARAADGVLVAAIDTAGAARVGRVAGPPDAPRWHPLFETPATDPLLEIHALPGGDRLLALGLDHRLRLLDRGGRVVTLLDQPGFVPWQLRLAHTPGRPPAIVAVLADPVRVQPITLKDDTLTLTGEARRVVLDQGPNHNDLALAPDGSFVAALRRPRTKGKVWHLERIALATGERGYLAGEVDGIVRPRLHLVDGDRALLESGTGKGFWIDLGAAMVPQPGVIVERSKLPLTPPTAVVDLPGSTADTRMQSTTAAGLRAVPLADALIVDPLAEPHHVRLAADPFRPTHVALDGAHLAWIAGGQLFGEAIGDLTPPRPLGPVDGAVLELFLGREHLIVVSQPDVVTLRRWSDGSVVAAAHTREPWRLVGAAYHAEPDGRGRVAVIGKGLAELRVDAGGLGDPVKPADPGPWPELAQFVTRYKARLARTILRGAGHLVDIDGTAAVQDREYVAASRRLYQLRGDAVLALEHFRGVPARLVPSPAGPRVAVVDHATVHPRFRFAVPSVRDVDPIATVTVVEFTDPPRALWSRSFRAEDLDLAWSADGAHLAVAGGPAGGHVFHADTGAPLHTRHDVGFTARRDPDRPAAPPAGP